MKNYHTHTYRCRHATGDVMDYATIALDQGGTVLGISDHAPLPDGRWPDVRMRMDELGGYVRAIEDARAALPGLTILQGLECEWDPAYFGFFQEELLGKRGFQYLIGACHWFPFGGEWLDLDQCGTPDRLSAYSSYLVEMMESGLFAFIAHPDAFGMMPAVWDADRRACAADILRAARDLRVPLEINGYGTRMPKIQTAGGERLKYPWLPFWELAAEFDIRVVCNSDAHAPEDALASIEDCRRIAERFGLARVEETFLLKAPAAPAQSPVLRDIRPAV